MTKIKVYQFQGWDQSAGEMRPSRHLATPQTIRRIRCELLIGGVDAEIDPTLLDGNGLLPISPPRV